MRTLGVDMCYKLFINYAYFLGLTPRRNRRTKQKYRTLASIAFLFITAIFFMSFYYRFNTQKPYHGATTRNIILELLFDILVILGLVRIGLALKTCLSYYDWNDLYENLDALKSPNKCCKGTGTVLCLFILTYMSQTYILAIRLKIIYLEIADVWNVLIIAVAPALIFYHSAAMATLMLLMLMEIEGKLSEVKREYLTIVNIKMARKEGKLNEARRKYLTIFNIKMARMVYSKVAIAAKMFNRIFAYQLLIKYIQWLIAIEIVFLRAAIIPIGDNSLIKNLSFLEIVVMALANTFQVFFGPCAIAFSCDSVISEADKLLAACQEAQEIFDTNSSEYRELESLASYINTKMIKFTAANFVEIKRSTLLSIVAAAATYFVALVQFY